MKDMELARMMRLASSMGVEMKAIASRVGYSETYVSSWLKNSCPREADTVKAEIVLMMRERLHELNEKVRTYERK